MTWFKVDDKFHSHSKIRKVLAEAPAALALWTVAGSWSSDNLTDGFVPDHQLPWLIPSGADDLARQLVSARLWRRVRGGYQFHEWSADADGTRRNPTREEVETERRKKAEAGRKGGLARAKNGDRGAIGGKDSDVEEKDSGVERFSSAGRSGIGSFSVGSSSSGNGSSTSQARASAGATDVLDPPTRPDPTFIGGALGGRPTPGGREAPPPRCPEHLEHPTDDPCRACGDARRARTRWELADSERRRTAPQCRTHRGQPAANCGLCRADQLAQEDS